MGSMKETPKQSDDYDAKLRMWAANPRVYPLPKIKNMPRIESRKFNSYQEFQEWKERLLEEIVAAGGLEWTT